MLTCDMTCDACFYGQESYFQEPIAGRTKAGVETWTEEVMMSSVVCKAEPVHKIISRQCGDTWKPDIIAEPEYHTCGRGRWWEGGKWIRLIDAEDAGLEQED